MRARDQGMVTAGRTRHGSERLYQWHDSLDLPWLGGILAGRNSKGFVPLRSLAKELIQVLACRTFTDAVRESLILVARDTLHDSCLASPLFSFTYVMSHKFFSRRRELLNPSLLLSLFYLVRSRFRSSKRLARSSWPKERHPIIERGRRS